MTERSRRLGVVLFQLGGPDNLEAIEPFLYNLFSDPDIINFPFASIGRRPLAKLIATTRAKKVQNHYACIGGGSPIRKHTEQQASALEKRLGEMGIDAQCFVAMRYWHPFTAETARQVMSAGCDQIVLLPLYPQYSSTTTGSSLREWARHFHDEGVKVSTIDTFYRLEGYLDSVVEKIDATLHRFPHGREVELVFSAHSVPVSVIENGDPYQRQIEETVKLVMNRGGWPNHHRLCYQSKVGASKWLQPSLRSTIRQVAVEKINSICVVPIAFVSDHVETLSEIDTEAREQAIELNIKNFEMTPGLNDSPTFITALAGMIAERIAPVKIADLARSFEHAF